ncbi:Polysaccharide biosynthesis protein [Citrifermentans bremense]|uniref:Polysaccharide biosynthesis protein n=1 Tax=Citrifermentans bremense TaxID=60035 RepID=A0A6S6M5F2_9BACT|nr:flippase [Citrifermentans bremense]BCG48629.1 Polysaccharide biosynthesis protein [Citrifermentans bremense]
MNQGWVSYLPAFLRKKVEGRQELQKVLTNTGWLFGDRLLRMGVGLFVGIWIARYLGPTQYGLLSYASSMCAVFSAIAILGLDAIVVREVVREPEREQEILGTVMTLRLAASLAAYLLTVGATFYLRPDDRLSQVLVAVMGWTLIFGSFDTIDLWFQSKVQSKYVVYAKNSAFIISSAVRGGLVLAKAPLVAFAAANSLEFGLAAVGLCCMYRHNGQFISRWRVRLQLAWKLLSDSWPLLLSGIVFMVYLRIDQIMLGQMSTSHELGVYASAVKIAEIWFFIPTAIVSSVFPNIIRARETDEKEFYGRLQKLYNLLAFLGYVIAIPTTFLAGIVVSLFYGEAYSSAAPMLVLLIWSDVFANLAVARNAFLMAMNWTRVLLVMTFLGALANIALNYLLVPKYGGVGAAAASVISYWVAGHGACYLYKPLRRTAGMMTRAFVYPRFW